MICNFTIPVLGNKKNMSFLPRIGVLTLSSRHLTKFHFGINLTPLANLSNSGDVFLFLKRAKKPFPRVLDPRSCIGTPEP